MARKTLEYSDGDLWSGACPACDGKGEDCDAPCLYCDGNGEVDLIIVAEGKVKRV